MAASRDDAWCTPVDGNLLWRGVFVVTLIFLGRPFFSGDFGSESDTELVEDETECEETELKEEDVRDSVE